MEERSPKALMEACCGARYSSEKQRKYGVKISDNKEHASDETEVFAFRCLLGEGAYSQVWLSQILGGSQEMVAVKKFDRNKRSDDLAYSEIQALRVATEFPFIVQLHSSFRTPKHLALVMKFAGHGTLHKKLEAMKTFSEVVSRFYAAEIAEALFFLHINGIIHRNLNLSNLLLTEDGHIQLCDFGLSYLGDIDERDIQQTWDADLALQFAAPEYPFPANAGKESNNPEESPYKYEVYPARISPQARKLLAKLLAKKAHLRIGRGEHERREVTNAAFFKNIDWYLIGQQAVPAPFTSAIAASTPKQRPSLVAALNTIRRKSTDM